VANVLLIDDDQIILNLLETVLSMKNHTSCTADNGTDGLQLAQEQIFDLVITDLSLPGVTGWQIIEHLKSNPATSGIAIVALSAHNSASDRDAAYSAGCDAYIAKPFDSTNLVNTVETVLKAR